MSISETKDDPIILDENGDPIHLSELRKRYIREEMQKTQSDSLWDEMMERLETE